MTDDVEREAETAWLLDFPACQRELVLDERRSGKFQFTADSVHEGYIVGFKAARAAEQREPGRLSPEWLHQLPKVPAQPTTAELVETVRGWLPGKLPNESPEPVPHAALTELARRAGGE